MTTAVQQRLTLEEFPRPALARVLSPNGRASWPARYRATQDVHTLVRLRAAMVALRPMRGLVTLWVTWVVPDHRRRGADNHSTGVLKAVVDALVRGGYLLDDDTDHLRLVPAAFRVERGRRALVLDFWSDVAAHQPIGGGRTA